ncbi:RNA polymerase sigma factor [Sediminibacterium roseum]|uniref:RNA polymerase sigma factor n=2 Tax=Sediminibacterium roseum TaxID=1978412 RepID=A0ABW9ZWZ8_9BACT|nr:RNA polymerase sigma factor [Sediminibacterium roseum]
MMKVKNGDLDRLGLLFERYNRQLFGFLFHMTGQRELSEDLVQNVFYRILKYKHTFRGDGEFKTWMYHMARNVVNDNGRSIKRTIRHQELTEMSENIGGGFAADETVQKKQELATLRNAMANLSEESREILVLSKFQELKYNEIAQILDITEGAVKVRVHRAVSQLKTSYLQIAN